MTRRLRLKTVQGLRGGYSASHVRLRAHRVAVV